MKIKDMLYALWTKLTTWSGFAYTWDVSTDNKSDTWVPVFNGNKIQHRVEQDWVVEKGTGNGFTYQKWNSGKAECWGTFTKNLALTSTGSIGRGAISNGFTYPSGLFKAAPSVFAEVNSTAAWTGIESTLTTGVYAMYIFSHTAVAARNFTISIHAIGKWK